MGLPGGWRRISLAELGAWFGGGTPSKGRPEFWEHGTVPWLSPKDMGPDLIRATQDHITEAAVAGSSVRRVPGGAVVFVVRSGILERTLPIAVVPFEVTLNQDMKALVPHPNVDARWIAWGLRSREQELLRECRKSGTTVASIDTKALMAQELPVPPLDQQRRIVEVLEDRLSRLDAADAGLVTALERLVSLRESVIQTELTGRRGLAGRATTLDLADAGVDDGFIPAMPPGWRWKRLHEVADVVGGVTKDGKRQSDATSVELPYLRVANVQRGRFDLSAVTSIIVPQATADRLRLLPGDVLLNEGGDRDKLGRGWVWEGQLEPCIHQNHVFRARVRDSQLDPYLLSWAANSFGGRWCERNGRQSVNLASISLSKIRMMPIPVPPVEEQEAIAKRIGGVMDASLTLKRDVALAMQHGALLRRALLGAAFSGRLG